jgi:hypothetical protein
MCNVDYPTIGLYEVLHKINPLDCILFKGSSFLSRIILEAEKVESGCDAFSHVGIVVNRQLLPDVTQMDNNRLYLLESTMLKKEPDVVTGKHYKFGVQIRDLEDVIRCYLSTDDTKVLWARLKNNPWYYNRPLVLDHFNRFYQHIKNSLYDINIIDLIACVNPKLRLLRDIIDAIFTVACRIISTNTDPKYMFLFCSELVTMTYQEIEVLDKSINPANISPVDLLKFDIFDQMLYLSYDINHNLPLIVDKDGTVPALQYKLRV